jgi:hypothetical protein
MGRTPHLYHAQFNDGGLDGDLVRVPLTFTRADWAMTPSLARECSLLTVCFGSKAATLRRDHSRNTRIPPRRASNENGRPKAAVSTNRYLPITIR